MPGPGTQWEGTCKPNTVQEVSESLKLTIVFEQGDEGWIVASVPEVPGALSQGRTREEVVRGRRRAARQCSARRLHAQSP
jgi:predicted RNase H-like HicB family nuclease